MRKIGIQGIKGSYHDQVAKEYFGDSVEVNEFLSFDELADSVVSGDSNFGIMAIENSIAGSIIPNYALIDNLNLYIVGEYFVNINHQLMVYPGVYNHHDIMNVDNFRNQNLTDIIFQIIRFCSLLLGLFYHR